MANSKILSPFILSWEGGFSNDKDDKGGATMKGITISTYRSIFGSKKTVEDLKKMTIVEWETIYKRHYWNRWMADNINSQSVANLLVDWLWMSGTWAVKHAQKALGVKADGIVGPKTLNAINNYPNEKSLFYILWNARRDYILRISVAKQKKFRQGWLNRLSGIKYGMLVCNGGKIIDY